MGPARRAFAAALAPEPRAPERAADIAGRGVASLEGLQHADAEVMDYIEHKGLLIGGAAAAA